MSGTKSTPERGCVEDQPQPCGIYRRAWRCSALRLVFDTAALRLMACARHPFQITPSKQAFFSALSVFLLFKFKAALRLAGVIKNLSQTPRAGLFHGPAPIQRKSIILRKTSSPCAEPRRPKRMRNRQVGRLRCSRNRKAGVPRPPASEYLSNKLLQCTRSQPSFPQSHWRPFPPKLRRE